MKKYKIYNKNSFNKIRNLISKLLNRKNKFIKFIDLFKNKLFINLKLKFKYPPQKYNYIINCYKKNKSYKIKYINNNLSIIKI